MERQQGERIEIGTTVREARAAVHQARGKNGTGGGTPERLREELRRGHTPALRRRRGIVGLSLAAIGAMGTVAAYQTGLLRRLPELPWQPFDAAAVTGSAEAYALLGTPDGALGLGSYATTLALAAAGGANRAKSAPWIPLALGAKALLDTANAARLAVREWRRHRALCSWCLVAVFASFATLPLALPEARTALEQLRGGV